MALPDNYLDADNSSTSTWVVTTGSSVASSSAVWVNLDASDYVLTVDYTVTTYSPFSEKKYEWFQCDPNLGGPIEPVGM
jgi:hypothetical protein